MAAADLTPKSFMILGANWKIIGGFAKVTQSDWISLNGIKGILGAVGLTESTTAEATETLTYGTITVDNSGTAYTATTGSIVFDGGTATRVPPYYALTASGEIIEVLAETLPATAAGTATIRRGCFGTTASATGLANNNVLTVLNQLFLGSSTVGGELIGGLIMPDESGGKMA